MNSNIDIVIPWVDGNDPIWQKQKQKFETKADGDVKSNIRFQSWDNFHLWFRAIEKHLPWYNKIFLLTFGHIPSFLNDNNPRIRIVRHDEYIPEEYLPTFNSNTIEMNIHRISDLSENFVLFNDDVFPLERIDEEYYFQDDKVCDEAVENVISTGGFTKGLHEQRYAQVNNMFIINKYFKKAEVQKKNWDKWYCKDYGDRLERTKACSYWYDFPGFYDPHMASAMKKSTLAHLWEIEHEALDKGSRDRFRGAADITQYLIRYWQICTGDFVPRRTQGKVFFPTIKTYKEVVDAIRNKTYPMISFNENCTEEEFIIIKEAINDALKETFTEKCSFEK